MAWLFPRVRKRLRRFEETSMRFTLRRKTLQIVSYETKEQKNENLYENDFTKIAAILNHTKE